MKPYRILSMDGGGIRGILTARILERVDARRPGFLKEIDLFAGTSTGGLLALGLASGMTPGDLRGLYQQLADHIFADPLVDDIKDLGNLIGAEFSWQPLKETLENFFPVQRLADLPQKVLVAAFDLDNEGKNPEGVRAWKMKFFHNYPSPGWDGEESVVDVGVRTSVAPAYFPVYQGYIDGGVAAASPAMCAIAQAIHGPTGGQPIESLAVLSMGTGFFSHYLEVQDADWGLAQWAPHMLYIMLESGIGLVDYQCKQLLNNRYLRVDPTLPFFIDLGQIQYIPELLEAANQVKIDPIIEWVDGNFNAQQGAYSAPCS